MEGTTVPNWLELPREVTENILMRVDVVERVTSACLVCPLWWNICKNPSMWLTNDIGNNCTSNYDLVKILLYAIDRSCGKVEAIDIADFCSKHVVETMCHYGSLLQKLMSYGFLYNGSIQKPEFLSNNDIIGTIGERCPLLKSLKIGSTSDKEAFAISKTMSGLRHLKIDVCLITKAGLLAILDGCPHLETLHTLDCIDFDLSENLEKRCRYKIKDFIFLKYENDL